MKKVLKNQFEKLEIQNLTDVKSQGSKRVVETKTVDIANSHDKFYFACTEAAMEILNCKTGLLKYYRDNKLIDWYRADGHNYYDLCSIETMPIPENEELGCIASRHFNSSIRSCLPMATKPLTAMLKQVNCREALLNGLHDFLINLTLSIKNYQTK